MRELSQQYVECFSDECFAKTLVSVIAFVEEKVSHSCRFWCSQNSTGTAGSYISISPGLSIEYVLYQQPPSHTDTLSEIDAQCLTK